MFHILVDHNSKKPMYLQIYEYIVQEIKQGHLNYNDKLPSGRELAQDLNISRNTVNMAYEQLESEGYIEAQPKRGYYVREIEELTGYQGDGFGGAFRMDGSPMYPKDGSGDTHYNRTGGSAVKSPDGEFIDFSPFGIDLRQAPSHRWQKIMKETMLDTGTELFQNGDPQGDLGLRIAIRDYLHRSRGVNCSENQIIIGAGTDYLLMLLTRLLPKDRRIAMENPAYQQAYRVFRGFEYPIEPIPIDEEGMEIQALKESNANLAFVTPSHQFPSGVVMPINRRLQLLNWAYEKEDAYILEDDYDSEFRYQGKPIPALQGLDCRGKVIYIGTLSKAISPAIRMGYMVLPQGLYETYLRQASFYATTVSRINQEIIRRFMVEGYFERHLNRMRGIYRAKHDFLLSQLLRWQNRVLVEGHSAGVHVLLKFPNQGKAAGEREAKLVEQAKQVGVKVYPLSSYYIAGQPKEPTLLLGYAQLTEDEIAKGLQLLEEAWKIDTLQ